MQRKALPVERDVAREITTVEIVEKSESTNAPAVVVPNTVRINGREVLVPANCPPIVHESSAKDGVRVTVTFFAHRVTVGME